MSDFRKSLSVFAYWLKVVRTLALQRSELCRITTSVALRMLAAVYFNF